MIDLIISTVLLSNIKIPYVTVSPFLRPEDKKLIKEILKIGKENLLNKTDDSMLDGKLTFPQISAASSKEVMKLLGNALIKNSYAKDGIVEDVLSREKKFPTGINTEVPFAIPHAGPEFTIKKGLAIATLKQPVKFREMGNPERVLDVRIVIMSALTGKEEAGKEFYKIIQRLKENKTAKKLLQCNSSQTVKKIFIK